MPELTGKNSSDLVQNGEISSLGIKVSKPLSTEWTDEKHSQYISSMEASFVRKLHNLEYRSNDQQENRSRGRSKFNPNSSTQSNANTQISSGKFKVLRGGCWENLNLRNPRPQLDISNEARALPGNPCLQHLTSAEKRLEVASPSLEDQIAPQSRAVHLREKRMVTNSNYFSSRDSCLFRQDTIGSVTEGSDQNFDNEGYEGEHVSSLSRSKRMKTEDSKDSTRNQVVPIWKSPITEDSNEKSSSRQIKAEFVSDEQSQ